MNPEITFSPEPITPALPKVKTYTLDQWMDEADRLFGHDSHINTWRFRCPSCGNVQTALDLIAAGVPADEAKNMVYTNCIGRYVGPGKRGCDWTLNGPLKIHKVEVIKPNGAVIPAFEFAEPEPQPQPELGEELGRSVL